jgi:hypothetical protein
MIQIEQAMSSNVLAEFNHTMENQRKTIEKLQREQEEHIKSRREWENTACRYQV